MQTQARAHLLERYKNEIEGVLGCFDRVVISGTLLELAYPGAVQALLYERGIGCFDLAQLALPLREAVRANAEEVAAEAGLAIEFLPSKGRRKDERIAEIVRRRGRHPGLVHIFAAMEHCTCYKPWHDKQTGRSGVRLRAGRCLHYYFYLMDKEFGLMFVRVPTWMPFRLEVYFNQHQWLCRQLEKRGVAFALKGNALEWVEDWGKAQELCDGLEMGRLHGRLNALARKYCPIVQEFQSGYHWSLSQVEYALDLVWKSAAQLSPVYEEISRQAILSVRAGEVARFLGKPLSRQAAVESDFHTRVEGTRIKHQLGANSLKMYDKGGKVLRLECTSYKVNSFSHYRKVVHRDGAADYQVAPLKKSIYSLKALRGLMEGALRRYLRFVSELEEHAMGRLKLERITRRERDGSARTSRGFNFFAGEDLRVLLALVRGEYQISGLSNRRLAPHLKNKNSGQISRILKRLRLHGLIKRIRHTYKYYLTALGQRALIAAMKLKEHLIIPTLHYAKS